MQEPNQAIAFKPFVSDCTELSELIKKNELDLFLKRFHVATLNLENLRDLVNLMAELNRLDWIRSLHQRIKIKGIMMSEDFCEIWVRKLAEKQNIQLIKAFMAIRFIDPTYWNMFFALCKKAPNLNGSF